METSYMSEWNLKMWAPGKFEQQYNNLLSDQQCFQRQQPCNDSDGWDLRVPKDDQWWFWQLNVQDVKLGVILIQPSENL